MTPALALNELQAGANPSNPPALVPLNDDFAVINNNGAVTQSLAKTNLYRAGVGQPPAANAAGASGTTYCQQYAASGLFIANNQALFQGKTSPAPAMANNLFTFLAQRFSLSFGPVPALGCTTIFGVANPVTLTMNGQCIVTAAKINTQVLQNILNGVTKPVGAAAAQATDPNAVASTTSVAPSAVASMFSHNGNQKHWKRLQRNNVVGFPEIKRRFRTDVTRRDAAAAAMRNTGFIEK
jgi:hypothetical protein